MGFAFALIFAIFFVPIGLYVWYVAIYVPRRGRRRQEQAWRLLADRIGGRLVQTNRVADFHALSVPFGAGLTVRALVFDRAAHDKALPQMRGEIGGWRTFVQADVPNQRGVPLSIEPRAKPSKTAAVFGRPALEAHHLVTPLLSTPNEAVHWRLTPDLEQALMFLGDRYDYVQAGPSFVNLEIPGVCTDPAVIEAALRVVGTLAQPT